MKTADDNYARTESLRVRYDRVSDSRLAASTSGQASECFASRGISDCLWPAEWTRARLEDRRGPLGPLAWSPQCWRLYANSPPNCRGILRTIQHISCFTRGCSNQDRHVTIPPCRTAIRKGTQRRRPGGSVPRQIVLALESARRTTVARGVAACTRTSHLLLLHIAPLALAFMRQLMCCSVI